MPPHRFALEALQQVLPHQIQLPSHQVSALQTFLTGTAFVLAKAAATQPGAGAIDLSTDTALAPMSATAAPTGANAATLASNAAPAQTAPVTNTAASSQRYSVGGYIAGTFGDIMHNCVRWIFTLQ
jgi:cell envelope opacity-associated protein A